MISRDLEVGAKVMMGDRNWQAAGPLELIAALLFGRREEITYLDMVCTIRWWRGSPYLSSIRRARA